MGRLKISFWALQPSRVTGKMAMKHETHRKRCNPPRAQSHECGTTEEGGRDRGREGGRRNGKSVGRSVAVGQKPLQLRTSCSPHQHARHEHYTTGLGKKALLSGCVKWGENVEFCLPSTGMQESASFFYPVFTPALIHAIALSARPCR